MSAVNGKRHKSAERLQAPFHTKRYESSSQNMIATESIRVSPEKLKLINKEENRRAKFWYDEDGGLIVYDVNATVMYEDTREEDPRITYSRKEKSLLKKQWKVRKKNTWERRKEKVKSELTPSEKLEFEETDTGLHRLFPEYPRKFAILIPKCSSNTLLFCSRFECGNLQRATFVGDNEYNLLLRSDIGTEGYAQWYYFCVYNVQKDTTYTFNILNLRKSGTSYTNGMKPSVYSKRKKEAEGVKWHHAGTGISYYKNAPSDSAMDSSDYSLTFSYTFEYAYDCVYFAHCVPYSYSKLQRFLAKLKENIGAKSLLKIRNLCYTFAMNKCPYLIITDSNEKKEKPAIVVTARVHPGESNSSYVAEGLIDFLLSEDHRAKKLRSTFVFYVIPMLNPDGVIFGNYRCSLLGMDLNRKWTSPSKILHSTIYFAKELIKGLAENGNVAAFCDFHGHSSSKDVFLLGCQSVVGEAEYQEKNKRIRLFARVLSKLSPCFSLPESKFVIEKNKLTTGRVVIYKEFNVLQSYTLETSCYGSEGILKEIYNERIIERNKKDFHFTVQDLHKIGKIVGIAYYVQQKIVEKEQAEGALDRKQIEDAVEIYSKPEVPHKPKPKIHKMSTVSIERVCHNSRNSKQHLSFIGRLQQNLSKSNHNTSTTDGKRKEENGLPPINKSYNLSNAPGNPLSIIELVYPTAEINNDKGLKITPFYNRLNNILANRGQSPCHNFVIHTELPEVKTDTNSALKRIAAKNRGEKKYKTRISLEKYVKEFNPEQAKVNRKAFFLKQPVLRKTPTGSNKVTLESVLEQPDTGPSIYRSMNMRWQLRNRKTKKGKVEQEVSTIAPYKEGKIEANGKSCRIFMTLYNKYFRSKSKL